MKDITDIESALQIALVRAAQRGDVESFERLYRSYYQKIYVVARATLRDLHEAEDVLQQTFVTAWEKLGSLRQPSAFPAWITRIAINACYSRLRDKSIPLPVDADEDMLNQEDHDEEAMPAVYAERADLRERLARVIDSLSDLQRQAIAMHYFEGLEIEEIAGVTGSTTNAVRVRLHAARKAIKERIVAEEKKSGERFWGVAGVPLLALPAALAPQFASMGADAGSSEELFEGVRVNLGDMPDGTADAQGMYAAGAGEQEGFAAGAAYEGNEGYATCEGHEGAAASEAGWEEIAAIRQQLRELEEEDASLTELQAHIDGHASELVQMVGNWKTSFGDMESIFMTARVSNSYSELMGEAFSGGDYQLMCAHIDDFRVRAQVCRQQVQADLADCRERLRLAEARLYRFENVANADGLGA